MDLSAGAATGALRLGLQVVTSRRRPLLDVYYELRHVRQPDREVRLPARYGMEERTLRFPDSELILAFHLINLGGVRAEKVRLELHADFQIDSRRKLSDRPLFSGKEIPQLAPAQSFPLLIIDPHNDLQTRGADGKLNGFKPPFAIRIRYNGPSSWYKKPVHMYQEWRTSKPRSYTTFFEFVPELLKGAQIPPAE